MVPGASRAAAGEERTIEWLLVWAYRIQCAHHSEPGLDRERKLLHCAAADLSRPVVDGGGPRTFVLHPDAETIHETVGRLRGTQWLLVVQHARTGTRPEVSPPSPSRCAPLYAFDRKGRRYQEMIHRNDGTPIACRVLHEGGDDIHVAELRAWRSWRDGLGIVYAGVVGRLKHWTVLPLDIPDPY